MLLFGDVTRDLRRTADLTTGVPDRRHGEGDVNPAPVLPHPFGLEVIDPLSSAERGDDLRLLGRVPEDPLGTRVPGHDRAVQGLADDRVVRGLDDRGQRGSDLRRRSEDWPSPDSACTPRGDFALYARSLPLVRTLLILEAVSRTAHARMFKYRVTR